MKAMRQIAGPLPPTLAAFLSGLVVILLAACSPRTDHPTALAALTESPGFLGDPRVKSVEMLLERPVAGGRSLLYRWQTAESAPRNTYCVAVTFVTPEGKGWRAQSSGTLAADEPFHPACQLADREDFVAGWYPGGNVTSLTTVFGLSDRGAQVRVEWSDGQVSLVAVQDGAFLEARPETLRAESVELLGSGGAVLDRVRFGGPGAGS